MDPKTPFIVLLVLCYLTFGNSQNGPSFTEDILERIEELSPEPYRIPELTPFDLRPNYDFIIVGSGPAGSVLANRLSENPDVNVLLLEAGGLPSTIHRVPSYADFADRPQDQWGFRINPYPGSCLGTPSQQCAYTVAKLLGGSSSFNYMIWARGNRNDYNRWMEMGNHGWGFDDLLPLFKTVENATLVQNQDSSLRGLNGTVSISHSTYNTQIGDAFIKAMNFMGIPTMDYNGASQIGVDYNQASVRNGKRHSAVNAYLDPVIHRTNLDVMINSLVSKVIIDPLTKTATGVQLIHKNRSYRVGATKEVIVSGGPIMSPQLLMLSGIGPREDLEALGIPVLQNLPVGRKYIDHTVVGNILFRVNTTKESLNLEDIDASDVDEWIQHGTGKLTMAAVIEAVAFLNNGLKNLTSDNAEVEIFFSPGKNSVGFEDFPGARQDIYDAVFKPLEGSPFDTFTFGIVDLYPHGQGRITLRGNSITNPPIIEYPFFKDPRNVQTFVVTIKKLMELIKTPPMRRIGASLYSVPIPDCSQLAMASDAYWECHVRHFSRNVCHAAATCKMGPASDPEAVVDPELRVHGIRKLRVADSSIAPTLVAGHTQAVAYVVGEKMARLLKVQWNI